jgi:RimJ/RimL family protein N-acetyltransferase
LIADPTVGVWTLHYVLRRVPAGTGPRPLVGVAGYSASPTGDGVVEIGYAIAVEHQCQGYATEAVEALLQHAFADRRVLRVVATTYVALQPSIRVLQKTGFSVVSRKGKTGVMRFERARVGAD